MVAVLVKLLHQPVQDELKHKPDERAESVAVRLRNLEVEAHRRFSIDKVAHTEIRARKGLLDDWVVVQRHRGDNARMDARCLSVGAIELPLNSLRSEEHT